MAQPASSNDVEDLAVPTTDKIATEKDDDEDVNLVDWDGPDDPANPVNWSNMQKWTVIGLVSFNTFNASMASSIFAPGVPQAMQDFHSNSSILFTFVVSVFIVGFIIGPLLLTPASELYGRMPVTHSANIIFLVASILCAVSVNIPMLIVFRLIMGLSGCVPVTLGAGFIADLMPVEKRGMALAIWTFGPLVGPVIGPVIGGYMALGTTWRWTFWLITILGAAATIASFLFMRETYVPIILERKAKALRKSTGGNMRTKYDKGQTLRQLIGAAVTRPLRMLIRSPIVLILSLYISIVYSYLYLLLTTYTEIFEGVYGFNSGEAGLAYLGLGVGFISGQVAIGPFSDRYIKLQRKRRGSVQPEDRLPPLLLGSCLVPIGLFCYGWSAEARTHWIVPIVGTCIFSAGVEFTFFPIQMYLIDAFTIHAASAVAANTVVRSIFGALVPLAGNPLYDTLGLGWGNSLLAFISIAFVPFSLVLLKYGARIRTNPRFQASF
ncbi:conserved hypothetical protein [Talaromyces stipitatus ATCC 10500]|uniref:Major facilitator superfamily (MFS) profile domain-containing protein n=2 Tax=Talaromyces stipitatus TaxID=28564 RepID=B8MFY1_TALSN|nr:uncharacterized protein TSTA_009690 [Talaromyces stipitatus ATCC 10500]AWS21686.1 MFS multidrug transporter [Talaromyces stipitatus]EED15848.1 conserved hypothetical protein [Talaromyces stipitatus ATCC 10500]